MNMNTKGQKLLVVGKIYEKVTTNGKTVNKITKEVVVDLAKTGGNAGTPVRGMVIPVNTMPDVKRVKHRITIPLDGSTDRVDKVAVNLRQRAISDNNREQVYTVVQYIGGNAFVRVTVPIDEVRDVSTYTNWTLA